MSDLNREGEGNVVHNPDIRANIYTLIIALGALLVGLGFITADEVQLWINLAVAVVALGSTVLARVNVPKR